MLPRGRVPLYRVTAFQLFLANTNLGTIVSHAALDRWPLITPSGDDLLRGFKSGKIRTEIFPSPKSAIFAETEENSFGLSQLERLRPGPKEKRRGLNILTMINKSLLSIPAHWGRRWQSWGANSAVYLGWINCAGK
jgi:hypothetical protein